MEALRYCPHGGGRTSSTHRRYRKTFISHKIVIKIIYILGHIRPPRRGRGGQRSLSLRRQEREGKGEGFPAFLRRQVQTSLSHIFLKKYFYYYFTGTCQRWRGPSSGRRRAPRFRSSHTGQWWWSPKNDFFSFSFFWRINVRRRFRHFSIARRRICQIYTNGTGIIFVLWLCSNKNAFFHIYIAIKIGDFSAFAFWPLSCNQERRRSDYDDPPPSFSNQKENSFLLHFPLISSNHHHLLPPPLLSLSGGGKENLESQLEIKVGKNSDMFLDWTAFFFRCKKKYVVVGFQLHFLAPTTDLAEFVFPLWDGNCSPKTFPGTKQAQFKGVVSQDTHNTCCLPRWKNNWTQSVSLSLSLSPSVYYRPLV